MAFVNYNNYSDTELDFYKNFNIPCKIENNGISHQGCNEYEWETYPNITAEIRENIEQIILKEWFIFKERFVGSYRFTVRPVPSDNLGCDEAYYMMDAQRENYSDTLLSLCVRLKNEAYIYSEIRDLLQLELKDEDGTSDIEL